MSKSDSMLTPSIVTPEEELPTKHAFPPAEYFPNIQFLRSSSNMASWRSLSSKEISIGELHIWLRYGEHSIQGKRSSQEDTHTATTDIEKRMSKEEKRPMTQEEDTSHAAYFAIYDGHGGQLCSDYAAANLHKLFCAEHTNGKDIPSAIKAAIAGLEKNWTAKALQDDLIDGTTACIAIIDQDKLTIANVGDSEAVLCRGGKAVALSEIHNPQKNKKELERIRNEGGILVRDRVGHPKYAGAFSLALSRTIGDLPFKHEKFTEGSPSGVNADPSVNTLHLRPEDDFLIIACDGVWDVLSHDDAVRFCLQRLTETDDPQKVAEDLVGEAYRKGSTDNISALIVTFKQFKPTTRLPKESELDPKAPHRA